jgi:hypothetical protein
MEGEEDKNSRMDLMAFLLLKQSVRYKKSGMNGIVFQICPSYQHVFDKVVKVFPLVRPGDGEGTDMSEERKAKTAELRWKSVQQEANLLSVFGHTDGNKPIQSDPVSYSMTPVGHICCNEFIPQGEGDSVTCLRCGLKDEDHIMTNGSVALLTMYDRGVTLCDFLEHAQQLLSTSMSFVDRQLYEIVDGIIACVLTELIKMWELGFAHRNLTMENVVVNDLFTLEQISIGKSDVEAHIVGFGSTRSINFESRQEELPITSPSGSPEIFQIPFEMALFETKDGFKDSPDTNLIAVDMACVGYLLETLMNGIISPFLQHAWDEGDECDIDRIENMKTPEDIDEMSMFHSKSILNIIRHILLCTKEITIDVRIEMLKKVLSGLSMGTPF